MDIVGIVRNRFANRCFDYALREKVNCGGICRDMNVRVLKVPKLLSGLVRIILGIFGYRP